MIYDHRTARDMWTPGETTYEHNVIPFGRSREDRLLQAKANAQAAEDDRRAYEVVPTREEERRLWEAYMAAIRRSVEAQEEVNKAHNAWMGYAEQVR